MTTSSKIGVISRVMAGVILAGVGCSTTTSVQAGSGGRGGASPGSGGSSSASGGSTVAAGSGGTGGGSIGSGGAIVSGAGGGAPASGGATVDDAGGGGEAGTAGAAGTSAGGSTGGGGAAGAGSGAGGGGATSDGVIETVQVPATGAAVSSKTLLDAGELFLLEATGTVDLGTSLADAEFGGFMPGGTGQDLVAGTDVGVDVGIKVERVPNGVTAGRKKWFGAFRADHTYYMTVTGAGTALTMKLLLSATAGPGAGTTGAIAVSIRRLSPVPVVTAVLETVEVPVIKQTVRTTMSPAPGTVYLLQIAGSGKTGGNNLGMGDADWMDWNVDGVGKEDIGDNNVDYGVGVDEADPSVSPRLRWWGPWRKDHTYYMLYAGTGSPIGFTYYDSGYGDNSATDQLTLHVFAVPR